MKFAKLGSCCIKIGSGATPKGGASVYVESGVALIRSQNVYNLAFSYNGLTHITDNAAKKLAAVTVASGDVLLNITGDSVARVCMVPDDTLPARVNQHVAIIRTNKDLSPMYLMYYLASPYMQSYMLNLASGKGASRNALTKGMIEEFLLPLPSIEEQLKISSILSSYDELIENNNRRIKILEQMAENLYKEWFVRFRFPGYEQAECENGIPKGWEYKTIEELSDTLRRGISPTYDSDGKYTIINQKCIRSSILDMSEAQRQSKPYKSELNLQDGDTVICSTGTGTLGRVGQVYGEYKDTTYDSHVTLVRANQVVGRHFLYWSLKELQPWFMNMGIGSTNQQELYRGTIKNAKILVPSNVDLLDAFENYIQDIHCQIGLLRDKIQNLTKQRDMLLPRLMSGKLEV